jgi:hypothetical protein
MLFGFKGLARGKHIFHQSDLYDSELILRSQPSTICCLVLEAQQQVSISFIKPIDLFLIDFMEPIK